MAKKKYEDTNVYEKALERTRWIYDNFDYMSGNSAEGATPHQQRQSECWYDKNIRRNAGHPEHQWKWLYEQARP